MHVCWHRNTSVSMVDFSVAVEVPHCCFCLSLSLSTCFIHTSRTVSFLSGLCLWIPACCLFFQCVESCILSVSISVCLVKQLSLGLRFCGQRTIPPVSFVLCFLSCLCSPSPSFCVSVYLFLLSTVFPLLLHLCLPMLTLLAANSPASESQRPLSRHQGPVPLSVVCWYRALSLSFSDTCWSREVLQQRCRFCFPLLREVRCWSQRQCSTPRAGRNSVLSSGTLEQGEWLQRV